MILNISFAHLHIRINKVANEIWNVAIESTTHNAQWGLSGSVGCGSGPRSWSRGLVSCCNNKDRLFLAVVEIFTNQFIVVTQ